MTDGDVFFICQDCGNEYKFENVLRKHKYSCDGNESAGKSIESALSNITRNYEMFCTLSKRFRQLLTSEEWGKCLIWESPNPGSPYVGPQDLGATDPDEIWLGLAHEKISDVCRPTEGLQIEFGISRRKKASFFGRNVICGIYLNPQIRDDQLAQRVVHSLRFRSTRLAQFLSADDRYRLYLGKKRLESPSAGLIESTADAATDGMVLTADITPNDIKRTDDIGTLVLREFLTVLPHYGTLLNVDDFEDIPRDKFHSLPSAESENKTSAQPAVESQLHRSSKNPATLLHAGPVNYASSNITARRKSEFHRGLATVVETAIERDVEAVVITGQLFATRSPATNDISALREELVKLHETGIPLLVAGSPRDHDHGLVDEFNAEDLLTMLSRTPVVVGDRAFYGLPPVDESDPITATKLLDSMPSEATKAVLAVPGTVTPPVQNGSVSAQHLQKAASIPLDMILAGDRRHRESHAPVQTDDCKVYQAGPTEYLLRKWVIDKPPEYPCSIRLLREGNTESIALPHRPFVLYRIESPSTDNFRELKERIEASGRTVLVQLVGPQGSDPLNKDELRDWLREQTDVSKVWNDRSAETTDRPMVLDIVIAEPPLTRSEDTPRRSDDKTDETSKRTAETTATNQVSAVHESEPTTDEKATGTLGLSSTTTVGFTPSSLAGLDAGENESPGSTAVVQTLTDLWQALEATLGELPWFQRYMWDKEIKTPYIGPDDPTESSYVWLGLVDQQYDTRSRQSQTLQFEVGVSKDAAPGFLGQDVVCGILLGPWADDDVVRISQQNLCQYSYVFAQFLADHDEYVLVTASEVFDKPTAEQIETIADDITNGFLLTRNLKLEDLPGSDLLRITCQTLSDLVSLYRLLAKIDNAPPVTLPANEGIEPDTRESTEEWDIKTLAAATELDESDIRESIDHLIEKGCQRAEAVDHVRRYLKDMLREDRLFAVSGVGPTAGYNLSQVGISTIDELQTTDPDEIAQLTNLSAQRVERLQKAAASGDLRSLNPDDEEIANRLLESESIHSTDTTLGTQDVGNTDQSSSDSRPDSSDDISVKSGSNGDNADRVKTDSESIITRSEAKKLLGYSVGSDAEFRHQQWQAIDALANKKEQLLLVQRTGWGKSTVYFIATYALRAHGAGPTLIISPLLSLMRDQIKNAEEELGLSATTINSKNEDEWERIYENVTESKCDILLISPERLKNQEFREKVLSEMADGFGMLVVDEAHCISDWGHDFRPDYQRVTRILERLPSNVPVAATTATANDRVVDDITTQLPGLRPVRGNLVRESLQIQAINMGSRQERLAWLAENLPERKRAGIVYCLTIEDVQRVTEWLQKCGYDVESYHGSVDNEQRQKREQLLLDNEVDALVATNALGMGFDKPDLKFVIHFQRPQNLIRYYQEIGRAGRDLDQAHAVVLSGPDDDDTAEYFIESAFPAANDFEAILSTIEESEEPLTKWDIRKQSHASNVKQCLNMLQVEGAIKRTDDGYVRTANEWSYDAERYEQITAQRYEELDRVQTFMRTERCLTLFIDEELDGEMAEPCGRCANCSGDFYPRTIQNEKLVQKAVEHYRQSGIDTISNRVYRYEEDETQRKIPKEHQLETGRSLAVYDEPGWGTKVREGKYETGRFDDDLVHGAAELIERKWDPSPAPEWITFVPSESTEGLLADYARRLADELNLELIDCVRKIRDTKPQKELSGSFEKCANVRNAFSVTSAVRASPVLLVDDIVQSKWTLTEVGRQLSQAGSGNVYPFALAKRRG